MGNQSAECKIRTDPELIVAVFHLEANQRKTGEQFGATEKMTINTNKYEGCENQV